MAHLDRFFHQILGIESGPKLVFLHGLLGSGANWRKIASAFENDYHILLFDQRGHGRSEHAQDGYDLEKFAQDLEIILNELGWNEVFLVGHSLGGRVAMIFAARWPQRVKALVIEDIGPEPNLSAASYLRQLVALLPESFLSREDARRFMSEDFPRVLSRIPDGALAEGKVMGQFLMTNIIERNGRWVWRFDRQGVEQILQTGLEANRWSEWQGLSCPTLLIRGERSKDLSPAVFAEMQKRRPNAQAIEIKDSGHWVHFDQSEAFIAAVKNFFASAL